MYLKSLEIIGFKSFAQKTILNFDPGVTAVVGPNGCGKSNVLDAIRWVLGEQSAKALRGGEMADVIFNGTDSRKAVGMAEVSLTFTDCERDLGVDWSEVRITRRLYRDGKSDYLLNKTPCRLRDIHNLFMDTGIGRSAYSIMEQGKIDLILSSRPDDRRMIFEEAAGITKYKAQKKEALRKLEYTEANLLRVTDIIKEVKRQIGSLQRQAGKARRYKSLMSDLKTLDTHLGRRKLDALDSDRRSVQSEVAKLRSRHAELEREVSEREQALTERRRQASELEEEVAAARQRVHEIQSGIASAENRRGFNAERVEEFQSLIGRYQTDIAAAEEKRRVQEEQLGETDSQLSRLQETLEHERAQLQTEEERAGSVRSQRMETQSELRKTAARASDLESRIAKGEAETETLAGQQEGSRNRLDSLQADIASAREADESLATRNRKAREDFEQTKQDMDSERGRLSEAASRLKQAREELSAMEKGISVAARETSALESRLHLLRQLEEAGEGLDKGSKHVLQGMDDPGLFKPAVRGALASLVETDAEFIAPVEAAFGINLQAIVIDRTDLLESAVEKLSSGTHGRASLCSREWIPDSAQTQMEVLPDGALAWAVDKVRVPREIAPLVATLLDRVAIVPDMRAALQLKRDYADLAFVTLEGESVSREGIATAGQSGGRSDSLLRRKVEIRDLQEKLAVRNQEAERLESRRMDMQSHIERLQSEEENLRESVQNAQVRTSTLEGQLALMEKEYRENLGRLESLEWEIQSLSESMRESSERLETLKRELGENHAELSTLASRKSELEARMESLAQDEAAATESLNDLRVRVATSSQRHESLSRQRQPMAARMQELFDLATQRRKDIETYSERIATLGEESKRLESEIEASREQAGQADAAVGELVEKRRNMVSAIGEIEGDANAKRREMSGIQERRSQLEVRESQLEMKTENLVEQARRRYHVDLREFQPDSYSLLCSIREQRKRQDKGTRKDASGEAQSEYESETDTADTAESASPPPNDARQPPTQQEREEEIDWGWVERTVDELTRKIDAMGPVNIEAIHEFDELEERHQFLESQFDDLTKSKEELYEVISKINATTKKLFAETFESVRGNFQTMFKELFGGGKADLMLVDDSDPLESGIEIIAKPPGKQLQSISLLSGGEKTMTAVALLFSIYMVKPSPFCVLDEMDAPLDESNISRFIKILDRFVSQSQFVVITHNKRTISRADVLYGVTMEEHGVSKLVGVKLTQRDKAVTGQHHVLEGESPVAEEENVPSIAESFGKSADVLPNP